jgi:hypothetical protein
MLHIPGYYLNTESKIILRTAFPFWLQPYAKLYQLLFNLSSSCYIVATILNANNIRLLKKGALISPINTSWGGCAVKGVEREIPLAEVWGCPPLYPPLSLRSGGQGVR